MRHVGGLILRSILVNSGQFLDPFLETSWKPHGNLMETYGKPHGNLMETSESRALLGACVYGAWCSVFQALGP